MVAKRIRTRLKLTHGPKIIRPAPTIVEEQVSISAWSTRGNIDTYSVLGRSREASHDLHIGDCTLFLKPRPSVSYTKRERPRASSLPSQYFFQQPKATFT